MNTSKLFILALAFSLVSCGKTQQKGDTVLKVKCVQAQSLSSTISETEFPGKVVSATEVNLGFRVAGIIERVAYDAGDYVPKGAVLAVMDRRDYQVQLSATQAEYDGIKAEVDRVVALYADSSVSQNDYDKAVHGLKMITAKLDAHRNALEDTELRAPFSGYLQKRYFDRGEAVSAGMPVVSFISASAPEIVVNLPAQDYVKRGDLEVAQATIDLYPGVVFPLTLKSIAPKANLNQLYEANFVVESSEGVTPASGMTTMVRLNYRMEADSSVVIPFAAVVENQGSSYVWLYRDGKVTLSGVRVSEIKSDGMCVINTGLSAGDMVVAAGVRSLKEGQRVEPLAATSPENIGGMM